MSDLSDHNDSLEERLLAAAKSDVASLRAAAEHLIAAGGKRVRPRFAMLLGELLGSPPEVAQTIGAAFELVHTATLIHDDVIDASDLRRGRPTVHAKYGTRPAVLVGDFLLFKALRTLTGARLFEASHELAISVGGLVEAELLQFELAYDAHTTLEQSRRIAEGKTAPLFAGCGRAVAISLGLPAQTVALADRLGRMIGYAFQVADDMIDLGGGDQIPGKPLRKDLREGQLTIPVQLARADDPALDGAIRIAFASRDEQDFVEAYSRVESSRALALGREELAGLRNEILAQTRDLTPDTSMLERVSEFFDRYVAHAA